MEMNWGFSFILCGQNRRESI